MRTDRRRLTRTALGAIACLFGPTTATVSPAAEDFAAAKKGCEGGRASDCDELGLMYLKGQGVGKDLASAAVFFRKACDGGNARGCANLGNAYEEGEGVVRDLARAAAFHKQACDGGSAEGCSKLAVSAPLTAPLTDGPPPRVCQDARDCNVAGTRALNSGQMAAAEAASEAEVNFAWCTGDAAQLVLAHNNLALLALRRGEPLLARLWAGVALKFDSGSPAALYNARLADERAARLPPAQGVTGTYLYYWGPSKGNAVGVQELPAAPQELHFMREPFAA